MGRNGKTEETGESKRTQYRLTFHPVHHRDVITAIDKIPQHSRSEFVAEAVKAFLGIASHNPGTVSKLVAMLGAGDANGDAAGGATKAAASQKEKNKLNFAGTFE